MRQAGKIGITGVLLLALALAGVSPARAVDGAAPARVEKVPGLDRFPGAERALTPEDIAELAAPDAVLEVRESAFNEAAAALEPVTYKGRKNWKIPDWVPVVGGEDICDPGYTVEVTGITVGIAPEEVSVRAHVRARWCGQAFTSDVDTTGDIAYDPDRRHFLVTIDPTSVTPSLVVTIDVHVKEYKFEVPLPITVDLGRITVPPIRLRSFFFSYETSKGSGTLHATPRDVTLVKRNGYVELQSSLFLW